MNTRYSVLGFCLALSLVAGAQTNSGGISADMLRQIEKAQPASSSDKAIFNAMASNNIDDLSKNFRSHPAIRDLSTLTLVWRRLSKVSTIRSRQVAAGCFLG